MKIIDGVKASAAYREKIKAEVAEIIDSGKRAPHLAAVLVGDDPASQTYVANKEKACRSVGITSTLYRLPADTSQEELLKVIRFINQDEEIDGVIVQLPLPEAIHKDIVLQSIDPAKDVDGFHPVNVGKMVAGLPAYLPATPYGILMLFEHFNIKTEGKNCVVLGRSNIVGTPMSLLLSRKANPGNATVTTLHSYSVNTAEILSAADIIIAAIGKPLFVKADWVKKGAVVVDVGIHRVPSETTQSGFKLIGDVDFEAVSSKASWITPVPGGVGPMTITALLMNTLKAFKNEIYS
ncbi:MAG: bifunctional 5,10-methylenetetrahydrofolate dehydrogenase/5,10-methenyltetrahydrofolate cyclohydrolase [Bacteroidia bacterium]|nr:bifunctional 5,10-methylenetetrahydrofolate dehydrogenase/5,10-methenyltetrahydrofolate cyclohydrolase [Bacteroidales bacterium]MDD3011767.1 bifunctional 5,10-methylenetetrahydrofolate dehydrogenase/5,10-methenyltetrahydrofolate cyclohydrolase [Bacteroidales bacterium]NCD40481.1 bifunctional 5,10-methylenetetrahydrofolate dehydrogenase/5,10-methenyltetrahydrofolate cyclohydrolase [Bacteroidia bacterium]